MIYIKDKNGNILKEIDSVNLRNANLRNADLRNADLWNADLRNADLWNADLRDADLRNANLRNADLRDADLRNANLRNADLRNANLLDADLWNADLRNANLRNAKLPSYQICPEEGSFIAWKKGYNNIIIKLQIPEEAKRNSSLVGRKCRAEFVKVLKFIDLNNLDRKDIVLCGSLYHKSFKYKLDEIIYPINKEYDDDIKVECSKGIHFFITRKEAEEYSI